MEAELECVLQTNNLSRTNIRRNKKQLTQEAEENNKLQLGGNQQRENTALS